MTRGASSMAFLGRARAELPIIVSIGVHWIAAAWLMRKPDDVEMPRPIAMVETSVDLLRDREEPATDVPDNGTDLAVHTPTPARRAQTTRRRPAAPAPSAASAPPPEAAQAAPIASAAAPAPTTETVATGDAPMHAGGVTQSGGTSAARVEDPNARAWGVPMGAGTDGDGWLGGADLSRKASLGGNRYWTCPYAFVGETAAFEGTTVVRLRGDIAADGTPQAFEVVDAPSPAFGAAATRCAKAERFVPAQDRRGRAIRGTTNPFRVVFSRF